MGAVYSISMSLKYKNIRSLIKEINHYIDSLKGKAVIHLDGKDRNSLDDLLKVFLTDKMQKYGLYYEADFNASYGWEDVIIDLFIAMARHLDDGSYFEAEIENDHIKFIVKDGEAAYQEEPEVTMGMKLVKLAMGGYADCNDELNEDDLELAKEIESDLEGIRGTALYDILEDICNYID